MDRKWLIIILLSMFFSLSAREFNEDPIAQVKDITIYKYDIMRNAPFDTTKMDKYQKRLKNIIEKYAYYDYLERTGKIRDKEIILQKEQEKAVGGGLYDMYIKDPALKNVSEGELRLAYIKSGKKYVAKRILFKDILTAIKVYGLLKDFGVEKFDSLCKAYTVDRSPSGIKGEMGPIIYGRVDDRIFNKIYTMNPGEISYPFKLKTGKYIIVYLEKEENIERSPYEEFKEVMRDKLAKKKERETSKKILKIWQDALHVKINDPGFKKFMGIYLSQRKLINLDQKEKNTIVATSILGDYTIEELMKDMEKAPYPMAAANETMMRKFIGNLLVNKIIQERAKEAGVDMSPKTQHLFAVGIVYVLGKQSENQIGSFVKVSDEEIYDYYKKHKKEFYSPALVKADEINVTQEKLAQMFYNNIISGKYSFDYYFKKHAVKGRGNNNYFEDKDKDIYRKIKNYSRGAITKPIKTDKGYSIFRIQDKAPRRYFTYEHWKGKIYNQLKEEKLNNLKKEIINDFRKKYVKILDPMFVPTFESMWEGNNE